VRCRNVKQRAVVLTAALLLVCGGLLGGCSSLTGGGTAPPLSADERIKAEEKRIEQIRNDQHMPEGIKASQISMIQANVDRIKKSQAGGGQSGSK
jgi:hypothetical protein